MLTIDDVVAKVVDIEKTLEQNSFEVNNLHTVSTTSNSSQDPVMQLLLKQQADHNQQLLQLTTLVQKLQDKFIRVQELPDLCEIAQC